MANTGRRRRRRRGFQAKYLLLIIPAAIVVGAVVLIVSLINKRYAPSKEVTDLEYYYYLTANPAVELAAAEENEMAVVFEDEILTERAFVENGETYIRLGLIRESVDSRFYYDASENILVVTNALETIEASPGESRYTVDGAEEELAFPVLTEKEGELYIALDFACEYSSASYEVYTDPARVVITYKTGEKTFCDALEKTQIRVLGGIKSEIVGTVEEGTKLLVTEDLDDWLGVVSPEGWKGYVDASAVTETYTEEVESDYDEPEYTSMNIGEPVVLSWGAAYVTGANYFYYDYTAYCEGVLNVYCPTWYGLDDTEGGIDMRSDKEYVDLAHDDGYLVWALFEDTDQEYSEYVLTHTSLRRAAVAAVIEDVLDLGIDGINVDFERVNSDYGDDFLQLLREISIECRKNGLYFTVDNYAPYDYNSCYHMEDQGEICDYVILMAYDDYLGSGTAGPNSSLPFIKEVVELSLEKVDADKLIVATPFYSRVWTTLSDGTLSKEEYSMVDGWNLMYAWGASPEWDDDLGLWYATYESYDGTVNAWLEDSDTIDAKLELLSGYGLAGYAFWRLGQEEESVWDVIAKY